MITWVVVYFLVVAEGRDGYKYEVPYSTSVKCNAALSDYGSWSSPQAKCVKGELPIYIPREQS